MSNSNNIEKKWKRHRSNNTTSSSAGTSMTTTTTTSTTSTHSNNNIPTSNYDIEFAQLLEMGFSPEDATAGLVVYGTAEGVVLQQEQPSKRTKIVNSSTQNQPQPPLISKIEKKLSHAINIFAKNPMEFKSYLTHHKQKKLVLDPDRLVKFTEQCIASTIVDENCPMTKRIVEQGFSTSETLKALKNADYDEDIALGILKSLKN
jgi:hypothetical protein